MPLLGAALAATTTALATRIDLPRPEEGGQVPEAVRAEETVPEEEVLRLQLPEDVQELLLMMKHLVMFKKIQKLHVDKYLSTIRNDSVEIFF